MRSIRTVRNLGRRNVAVLAALAAAALAAPLAVGASHALATSEEPAIAATLRLDPVDVAPVAAIPVAATLAPEAAPACPRKVRVVYGGYGTPAGACAAR